MALLNSLLLLLSLFAASNVLASPHVAPHHRAIAARVALPALDLPLVPLRKRQNSKRCRQRSSSLNPPSSTPVVVKPTPSFTKPVATTRERPTPTPTPAPATTQASPPKPTTTQRASGGGSNLPSFMVGTQTGQGTFYSSASFFSLHFFFFFFFFFLTNAQQLAWVHVALRTKIPTTSPLSRTCYLTTSRAFQRSLLPAIKLLIVPLPSVVTRPVTPIITPCVAEK